MSKSISATAEAKAKAAQKMASDHHAGNSAGNSAKSTRGNPDKIKPYQFRPGQSGNPGGRPEKPLTDAYRAVLEKLVPGDKEKRTFAELIALAIAKEAIRGKTQAAVEIADRVEGKATQAVEVSGREGGPLTIAMIDDIVDPDERRVQSERRIHELITKAGY